MYTVVVNLRTQAQRGGIRLRPVVRFERVVESEINRPCVCVCGKNSDQIRHGGNKKSHHQSISTPLGSFAFKFTAKININIRSGAVVRLNPTFKL